MSADNAYDLILKSICKLDRHGRIGFILGAIDDGMFKPPDNWQMASDDQLAHWGVEAFVNAAEHIVSGGQALPSELRGPKPFGVA